MGEHYRKVGEIRWLVHALSAPFRPGASESGDAIAQACLAQLDRWGVGLKGADGALPAPGVYGCPSRGRTSGSIRRGWFHRG